jgi:NADH dehydrogenase FAD-containing subunit
MREQIMNILILGGGYAGVLAALRLAGKSRNTSITLVNQSDTFVERIRLHQLAAGQTPRQHPIARLIQGKGIHFVQGRVTALDPERRAATVQTNARAQTLSYDQLVYALGSSVDRDGVPGIREHALTLGGVDAARELQARVQRQPNARVIVVGGGLTGIELTAELAETYPGLSITLLSHDPLGPNLSRKGREYLLQHFARRGVTVREGATVERIMADGVRMAGGEHVPADLTLWAGSFAVSPLARESGLAVNRCGQILIDPLLRSVSHPDIFAVGDAAATGLRMACATALPQGAHAADNLAALLSGQPLKSFRFGFGGRCISLGRHDGMVQMVNTDDSPREQIITGRAGALVKELICRYTVYSLIWTRYLPGIYWWPQPAEVTPQAAPQPQRA